MNNRTTLLVVAGLAVAGGLWYVTRARTAAAAAPAGPQPPAETKKSGSAFRDIGRMLDPSISGSVGNQALNQIVGRLLS